MNCDDRGLRTADFRQPLFVRGLRSAVGRLVEKSTWVATRIRKTVDLDGSEGRKRIP